MACWFTVELTHSVGMGMNERANPLEMAGMILVVYCTQSLIQGNDYAVLQLKVTHQWFYNHRSADSTIGKDVYSNLPKWAEQTFLPVLTKWNDSAQHRARVCPRGA